ncbi:phosphonate ABC transporter, permease protein PhnE [Halorubrum sp. CBA1125]|uniref:phosphonate ABC transporter, permease protein PhnE n=1 Tax=Halorubrum sp. CBA1125 TaxID=2668072 RepID=UPI0012E72E57|nr:phosphonate ABC transporter, permease protein PhnE [Halorubrum sp. CBA1125]MUW14287.1 phosphonate ABC transporter, permease protein PhnE [Halorubrum sp. CBA1125]
MATGSLQEWQRYDRRTRIGRYLMILASLIILAISWVSLELDFGYLLSAPANLADLFVRMYPPDWGYTTTIVDPMIQTINIAIVGTIVAVIIAFPVAFLSAKNTTPNKATYVLGKFIISFSRSVNGIIWGLITVIMFGPGALAGMVAVGLRAIGFVAKLLGEEIEEIATGSVEGVRATGAGTFLVFLYGIFPQIKPALVGISIYRWDINVRISTVIGFVGAGGIGVHLFEAIETFAWRTVLLILIAILGVVIVSEALSAYLRAKVR